MKINEVCEFKFNIKYEINFSLVGEMVVRLIYDYYEVVVNNYVIFIRFL